jgi:hypothetical protein
MRLKTADLEVEFDKAEDLAVILAALRSYLTPATVVQHSESSPSFILETLPQGPPPRQTHHPQTTEEPTPLPRASSGRVIKKDRHAAVAAWVHLAGRLVTCDQIYKEFSASFPSNAAVWQFLSKWILQPSCPLERVGRGYYRWREGAVVPEATGRTFPATDAGSEATGDGESILGDAAGEEEVVAQGEGA